MHTHCLLSESIQESSLLFDPRYNSWATELFRSHGDLGHVFLHVSHDGTPEDCSDYEDFLDALTDVLTGLHGLKPYFDANKFFDKNIKVIPSMHDDVSVRFDIYETISPDDNNII